MSDLTPGVEGRPEGRAEGGVDDGAPGSGLAVKIHRDYVMEFVGSAMIYKGVNGPLRWALVAKDGNNVDSPTTGNVKIKVHKSETVLTTLAINPETDMAAITQILAAMWATAAYAKDMYDAEISVTVGDDAQIAMDRVTLVLI